MEATLKQNVLISRLKPPYVMSSSRKWAGRLFQTRGPFSWYADMVMK